MKEKLTKMKSLERRPNAERLGLFLFERTNIKLMNGMNKSHYSLLSSVKIVGTVAGNKWLIES